MHIKIGYGLEGRLTDIASSRVIRNIMAPHFKAGDFRSGVDEGVAAILAHLGDEAAESPDRTAIRERARESRLSGLEGPDLSIAERILFGAFIFGIIGAVTIIGALTPGIGRFLRNDIKSKGRANVGDFVLHGSSSSSWSSGSSSRGGGFSGGGSSGIW